jgi:hypothetical protein
MFCTAIFWMNKIWLIKFLYLLCNFGPGRSFLLCVVLDQVKLNWVIFMCIYWLGVKSWARRILNVFNYSAAVFRAFVYEWFRGRVLVTRMFQRCCRSIKRRTKIVSKTELESIRKTNGMNSDQLLFLNALFCKYPGRTLTSVTYTFSITNITHWSCICGKE